MTSTRLSERGFSSDLTALVECEAGSFFVKAMRNRPGGRRNSILREREINPYVQPLSPVLSWTAEDDEWIALGFEVFEGMRADFGLGSVDLPVVVDLVTQIGQLKLPEVARNWPETRWDRFAGEEDVACFRGDALLYTDINPDNFLIGEYGSRVVDWAWPTRGAGFIDPATLVLQLISSGHIPAQAESWVSECPAWSEADPRGIDAFVRAQVRMHRHFAERRPDESWLKAMVAAAESWAAHRGLLPTLDEE